MSEEKCSPNPVNVTDEIANFIFTSKYARYREDLKRRETWQEAVQRVQDMHLKKFSFLPDEYKNEIIKAFDFVRDKKVLPSMRSLQYAGKAQEKNELRGYNCCLGHLETIKNLEEYFYLLLSGCGVGIGITERHIKNFPDLISYDEFANKPSYLYTIDDSIEGWAWSIGTLVRQYTVGGPAARIVFDYSKIRPKGARLVTSGGQAPGPDGLRLMHSKVDTILSNALLNGQKRLKTIQLYDILMHIADAVLSGGVRRSAVLCLFDKSDHEMMSAKTGNWFKENPQRARSNNSVLFLRNETTLEDVKAAVEFTKNFGEPGFVFMDDKDGVVNPCGEIACIPSKDGKFGFQMCNLTTINGTTIKDRFDFYNRVYYASLIGTLQAAYTKFPFLDSISEDITREEALLGVSILGILSNSILQDPLYQKLGAIIATNTNKIWAEKLGINQAARVTCVKPDGQSALAMGSMLSGIHAAHAHLMFRRIQVNKQDPVYQHFKKQNSHMCEESQWSANKTDEIITFPVNVPKTATVKSDLNAIQHLEIIKSTQQNWVNEGTSEANKKPLRHSVSCTVQVADDEWETVAQYLFDNKDNFTAVSLIPKTGDKIYVQAPNESVVTEEDISKFNYYLENYKPVNYSTLHEEKDKTKRQDTVACSGGVCEYA